MMNARERKLKRGAFLGGHGGWQGASRALWDLTVSAFDYLIDSAGKFSSTIENRITL